MNNNVVFTQKWIGDVVGKFFGKESSDITSDDIEKIKYLKIGESFNNDFIIQLSTEYPPEPFVDTDGGDEWGFACIEGEDIEVFLNEQPQENIRLSLFGFEHNNLNEEYAFSEEADKKWNKFKETVFEASYYEEIEDYDEFEKWYKGISENIFSDLKKFVNVHVLRINGMDLPDFECFSELEKLRVLELVETDFKNNKGIDGLKKLKQLCCWED